ncbi:ADP-ribose glycohydrolase MACROD1 isoform X1 [Hyla sarda]|uniref:ADP-ribose glycohydrolase MACROD1 isoform X1 n=1 Tax=Hyla sarda TaxID=327740 RepID=UPI0024C2D0D4|nr:ADP-ribose glycohydrolase MACROD1 isoform X1 [Hyla sarda]
MSAANSTLLGGGGVDGCIHRAAGPLLKLECSSLGGCETGQAKITGGYLLPAKYVIHTVGPVAQGHPGPSQKEELMNCYRNSMYLASESKLRTVAFPCISTGVFGYPTEEAAEVALGTIRSYLEEKKDKFDRIIICVFLEKDEEIYLRKLPGYFPFGNCPCVDLWHRRNTASLVSGTLSSSGAICISEVEGHSSGLDSGTVLGPGLVGSM